METGTYDLTVESDNDEHTVPFEIVTEIKDENTPGFTIFHLLIAKSIVFGIYIKKTIMDR